MEIKKMVNNLEGIHTIESIMEALSITRDTAIVYVSKLRKAGYVKTRYTPTKKRIYHISRQNRLGGKGYVEVINKVSPIQLVETQQYRVYGRQISYEEALIFAIKTRKVRYAIAAISLFNHITNWTRVSYLAKKNNVERQVGALYELARKVTKTRKIDERILRNWLPSKTDRYQFIVSQIKSTDYRMLENRWKVYLPLNKADVTAYTLKK